MTLSSITSSVLGAWFKAPASKLDELFLEAQRITDHTFKRQITLYKPGSAFPSISITGKQCQLRCQHCSGHFLEHMHAITRPQDLLHFCQQLAEEGGIGCLISGGCGSDGTLPLDPFLPVLSEIKQTTNLILNVHTGFLNRTQASQLAQTGIDCASVDVVGNDTTIHTIYGLTNRSTLEYAITLEALKTMKIPVAPHICVGLHHGRLLGELNALQMIHSIVKPKLLVIIAFMPTQGTPMVNDPPARPTDVAKVCALARLLFPKSEIALGCMRPRGAIREKMEELAIRAGATRLVQPTKASLHYLQQHGYSLKTETACCIV
ncbi:MAG: hypothetical protein ACFE89_06660 [Candidatus Hodarchaeota archaeon]